MADAKPRSEPGSAFASVSPRCRLLHAGGDLVLEPGILVLGRDADCDVPIDDTLASRRHARITTDLAGSTLTDLGSANGTWVNGERLASPRRLAVGDWVAIGRYELQIVEARTSKTIVAASSSPRSEPEAPTSYRMVSERRPRAGSAQPAAGPESAPRPLPEPEREETTGQVDPLQLFGKLADAAIALHQAERAEQVLTPHFRSILASARQSGAAPPEAREFVARYAVRLAAATRKPSWIDSAVELYTIIKRPLPAPVIDELYTLLRRLPPIDRALFRSYVGALRASVDSLGPTERFLLQRIAGLEQVPSARV